MVPYSNNINSTYYYDLWTDTYTPVYYLITTTDENYIEEIKEIIKKEFTRYVGLFKTQIKYCFNWYEKALLGTVLIKSYYSRRMMNSKSGFLARKGFNKKRS